MTEFNRERSSEWLAAQRGSEAAGQGAGDEPSKEVIARGDLYFLWHPTPSITFSGYGLTLFPGRKEVLIGLLMVDRPQPVDLGWLKQVEATFGDYQLVPMTVSGEQGITCQMCIEPDSLPYVRQLPAEQAAAIQQALSPLLEAPPKPYLRLRWDEPQGLWTSEIIRPFELPPELREVFERTGPGCTPAETNIGVVHVCHVADQDLAGFANKPALYHWQLARMPTAPVLRLSISIVDQPDQPYKFESFLNVGQENDVRVLGILLSQENLYLAFYGEDFSHRFTKVLGHSPIQREQLHHLAEQATAYWHSLPEAQRDFDQAKIEFQRRFPL